jgi:hypothetical protein
MKNSGLIVKEDPDNRNSGYLWVGSGEADKPPEV